MFNFKEKLMTATRHTLFGKKHPFWFGRYNWTHRDKNGNIIDKWTSINSLHPEGEKNLLQTYFQDDEVPLSFYLMLFNDTPTDNDTLEDITGEPTENGYSRPEISRDSTSWPTLELDSAHYMITSKEVIFQAIGGGWGPVTYAILTTVETGTSGLIISYVALSGTKSLAEDETLGCDIAIKLI